MRKFQTFNSDQTDPNSFCILTEQEKIILKQFKKEMNSSCNIGAVFAFFMAVLFLMLNGWTFFTNQYDNDSFIVLLGGAFMFTCGGSLCIANRIPKNCICKYAQYGIINEKWNISGKHNSKSGRFFDVTLTDGTRYRNALCYYKDYRKAQKGQKVFVIVLSGRTKDKLYGILLDNYRI